MTARLLKKMPTGFRNLFFLCVFSPSTEGVVKWKAGGRHWSTMPRVRVQRPGYKHFWPMRDPGLGETLLPVFLSRASGTRKRVFVLSRKEIFWYFLTNPSSPPYPFLLQGTASHAGVARSEISKSRQFGMREKKSCAKFLWRETEG